RSILGAPRQCRALPIQKRRAVSIQKSVHVLLQDCIVATQFQRRQLPGANLHLDKPGSHAHVLSRLHDAIAALICRSDGVWPASHVATMPSLASLLFYTLHDSSLG